MRAVAAALMDEGLFRTLLKCSAHLTRIVFLSVRRADPSAPRSGAAPENRGP